MTSGSVGTSIPQYASVARKQSDWASFVASVPSCSQLAPVANSSSVDTGTLECLRGAHLNDTEWMEAVTASENTGETVGFGPAFDSGDHAVFNTLASTGLAAGNWSKLPFIAGTNLDEGKIYLAHSRLFALMCRFRLQERSLLAIPTSPSATCSWRTLCMSSLLLHWYPLQDLLKSLTSILPLQGCLRCTLMIPLMVVPITLVTKHSASSQGTNVPLLSVSAMPQMC